MGKTRVASAVAAAVVAAGGRVAILVPPGLGFQWQHELRGDGLRPRELVRSLVGYLRGCEATPWSDDDVVLLSHQVANWRLGDNSEEWRWALLPELVAIRRKANGRPAPKGYQDWCPRPWDVVRRVAGTIHDRLVDADDVEALRALDAWSLLPWSATFCRGAEYATSRARREDLERVFGWGLGRFDLVVIDEAHKARGNLTGLSRLLRIVPTADRCARLGLTATPVALDVGEWDGTLERIGVADAIRSQVIEVGRRYKHATALLRDSWRTNEGSREGWIKAAAAFQQALSPYVLRRDKREDPAVRAFRAQVQGRRDYRAIVREALDVGALSLPWRRVVFAAEALSATVHGGTDPVAKRLRLTLANGHGVASVIDATLASEDERVAEGDEVTETTSETTKQEARARLWADLIRKEVGRDGDDADHALYNHPQLNLAIRLVEARLEAGEKVLVFGRYSRPMRVLHDLLNARARLRSVIGLDAEPWPEETLQIRPIDVVASRQMGLDLGEVESAFAAHADRHREYDNRREWLRRHLVRLLVAHLDPAQHRGSAHRRAAELASAIPREARSERDPAVTGLVRAVWELASPEARAELFAERESPEAMRALTEAFVALVDAAVSIADPDTDADTERLSAQDLWASVRNLVQEEFGPYRGGLARLLVGGTAHGTRRLLQAAFNRTHSFPKVLIAQSLVGREGLNLHEACRVVLLLHPEWNPGVVEQQIGRVDRIGSRWQMQLEAAIARGAAADQLPRIEVVMPVFEGTYDEHHWRVLQTRWDDLRAQLHGAVVPPSEAGTDPEHRALAEELNARAPNFSPPREPITPGASRPRG